MEVVDKSGEVDQKGYGKTGCGRADVNENKKKSEETEQQVYGRTGCDRVDLNENDCVLLPKDESEESKECDDKTVRETFSTSVRNELRCSLDSHLMGMFRRSPMVRQRSRTVDSIGIRVTPRKSITWAQKLESVREFKTVARPKKFRMMIKTLRILSPCMTRGD